MRKTTVFAAILCGGCSSPRLYATPPPGTQIDSFTQQSVPKTDILWVVGNHGSMASEQAALAAAFPKFFAHLQSSNLDYRIGVTTSDIFGTAGHLVGTLGLSSPVGNVIVGNSADAAFPDTADPQTAFQTNIMVGTNGSARDESLEAASMSIALLQQQAQADTAAGKPVLFLRPDAALFLIFVGDGPDYSPNEPGYYWRLYEQAKGIGNDALVQISAIAGDLPSGCCPLDCCPPGCTDFSCCVSSSSAPEWCLGTACCTNAIQESCFPADPGSRYYEVVEKAGGIFGSICSATFDQSLDELGLQALGLQRKFYLTRGPAAGTLQVEVDYPCSTLDPGALLCNGATDGGPGQVVSTCPSGYGASCTASCSATDLACNPPQDPANGWSYEPSDNAILFSGAALPALGSVIKVTYTLAGETLP
ncbi:MAG: hypothetical protein ACYDCL_06920 [Myxococcales bacterium]